MIAHRSYTIDPWSLREISLDLEVLAQSESLFALANGHVGWRANLDEGEPHELSGSYLNGVFESRPLPYAEAAYGYPDVDEVVVDVTNGKVLRLFVDDEPFDVRYGTLVHHERFIDFREGILERSVEWTSPSGAGIAVRSSRLVSLSQRAIGAIDYTVKALDQTIRIVVQSELIANEPPPTTSKDPRSSFALERPWISVEHSHQATRVELVHRTERSGLMIAAAMDHQVTSDAEVQIETECFPDLGRVTLSATLEPGQSLHLTKYVAYGWSSQRSQDALRDQVDAALTTATHDHFSGLAEQQHHYLADFWRRADVEIEGNDEIQQAVRFALFHLLQSSARAERRGLPAKGLTGTGYSGHTFWDTEMFVLPVLTYLVPRTVADALTWRHDTLPLARQHALDLGLRGAAFPWRTISGVECSGYWPAGTAAFHINADVADAVLRYLHATHDEIFEKHIGGEILIETARLWASLGHFDTHGGFRIDGVTGPDEYSAVADNNVYTNLLAQRNLRGAVEMVGKHPELAETYHVSANEIEVWGRAADEMLIVRDELLGVHSQSEGFTSHDRWNFESTRDDQYPLLLHFPYFDLYRKQVVKQADLVLAMYVCPDAFTDSEKIDNFDYYETITVRDSSLSACTQSVIASEVGYIDLAYDYLTEAALMDLNDLERNTRDGLHVASLAGTWIALVSGLGGMRPHESTLSFRPQLPEEITRLSFGLTFLDRYLRLDISHDETVVYLLEGDDLEVQVFGRRVDLTKDRPSHLIAPPPHSPRANRVAPRPPVGREPHLARLHGRREETK